MPHETDNIRQVLRQIHAHGPIPRSEIAKLTGLTEAAVSRISRRLIDAAILREGRTISRTGTAGRKFIELQFGDGAYVAAIGIRATNQWVQIADLSGRLVAQKTFQTEDLSDTPALLERCYAELRALIDESGIPDPRILGIGVAIVAVVDHRRGTVLRADTLGLTRAEVADFFRGKFGIPVSVDTYLNAMNLLLHGLPAASRQGRHVAITLVGIAIGGSYLMDGRLIRGGTYGAAQLGHVRVPGAGDTCLCGARGCLDTVSSARGILKRLGQSLGQESVQGRQYNEVVSLYEGFVDKARADAKVAAVLEDAGAQLGRVLAEVSAIIDPNTFLVGGFVAVNEWYWNGMASAFYRNLDPRRERQPSLERIGPVEELAPIGLPLHEFAFNAPHSQPDRLLELVR